MVITEDIFSGRTAASQTLRVKWGSVSAPTYMFQPSIHCSLRAEHIQRGNERCGEETQTRLVTNHILESPFRTDLSHHIEKTMLTGDISRETVKPFFFPPS